jgi:signal transduction histidine kinase
VNAALAVVAAVAALAAVVAGTAAARGARATARAESAAGRAAAEHAAGLARLREENDQRGLILESMDEAVILSDERAVVFANRTAERIFGAPLGALPAAIALPEGETTLVRDVTLHHPARRDLRVATTRVGGSRVLVVAQDQTEAKRIEQTRRDFVANASHEMKTPVAGILAIAETLQDAIKDDPAAAERFAATLAREAQRLSTLVQDLLSLARLEQPLDEAEGPVSLSSLLAVLCEEARPRCAKRSLKFADEIQENVNVNGRAEDLRLLARNLLDNAIRYTQPGGTVAVSLRAENGTARIRVADSGIGIPQKDLPRVFERFFRVDQARARDTGGTGLGLAIVRHVAESHGGTVAAESDLGRGSTFTVSLPVSAPGTM